MLMNEMLILKRENEEQITALRYDDVQTIKDIMKGMSIFKVNSYDAQVIKRDLIGMAQELELRSKNLHDAIGSDVKGFANDIIENSGGPCIYEILLGSLLYLTRSFFIWFLVISVGAYGGKVVWRVDPIILFFFFSFAILGFISDGLITPIFSMEKGFKKICGSIIFITLILVITIVYFYLYDIQNAREFNAAHIMLISGAAYLVIKYLNIKNIHKLASNKKNFIQDLS